MRGNQSFQSPTFFVANTEGGAGAKGERGGVATGSPWARAGGESSGAVLADSGGSGPGLVSPCRGAVETPAQHHAVG